jgi:hypothetical protein
VADSAVVGQVGEVLVRVRGGDLPGEIATTVRGIREMFIAYAGAARAGHAGVVRGAVGVAGAEWRDRAAGVRLCRTAEETRPQGSRPYVTGDLDLMTLPSRRGAVSGSGQPGSKG